MLKNSMDIVDVYAWTQVYGKSLVHCIIENAYRYKYAWLLKLKCRGNVVFLKVEPGVRIHGSKVDPPDKTIDRFTQYLRAHVKSSSFKSLSMPWWERIVVIETERKDTIRRHFVELVPRGVWVISDLNDKILYASKFEDFRDRSIRSGLQYSPPPPRGIPPWDEKKLIEALLKGKDLVRSIVTNWGLPGYVAEEILLRSGLYSVKSKKPAELELRDLENLVNEYNYLVKEAVTGTGYLVYRNGNIETYTPYRPRLFIEVYELDVKEHGDFNEVLDVYFNEFEAHLEALERSKRIEREISEWKKRVEEQDRIVSTLRNKLEEVTRVLSIIYEGYSTLEEIVECARRVVKAEGWEAVRKCGVSEYIESRGVVVVTIENQKFEFSVRDSFEKQVQDLIKKKGELEKKLEKATRVLEDLKSEVLKLEKERPEKLFTKQAPKYWYERYHWSITRGGFLVVAGRNAHQNEVVVKKYLSDNDIFLHADVHGAPATILLTHGAMPGLGDLEDAATLAACYSKAWKAGFSYVEVYWVRGSQVSKTPPPGEYLGKGAFMVYGERHYLRVPLRLGIGLRLFCDPVYGSYYKLFVGRPELVRENSIAYAVLVPGDVKQQEVAEHVARLLVEYAYRKTQIGFEITPQQVIEVLPGSSRVVEHGIGSGETLCREE